jgi:hypothetical protein
MSLDRECAARSSAECAARSSAACASASNRAASTASFAAARMPAETTAKVLGVDIADLREFARGLKSGAPLW